MEARNQPTLFEKFREPLQPPPCDPNIDTRDTARVSGQNALILAELRRGPTTNTALAELSLKYTSRISDLRAAGFTIECKRLQGGLTVYELKED